VEFDGMIYKVEGQVDILKKAQSIGNQSSLRLVD